MQNDIQSYDGAPFGGAKLALYLGHDLAVILRDATLGLVFADHWDLPGGGREGGETPQDCALRECREELGLVVPPAAIVWGRAFAEGAETKWFFVAHLPRQAARDVVFGDEGQKWQLMAEAEFLAHPKAVPAFQFRLARWVAQRNLSGISGSF
jgi:8-oxo-dGTP diphosphatase